MTEPNRLDEVVGGKYRIVRFLASGGMGSVYEAQHTVVRRRFAVKFLHHELAIRRELLARFQREAEAAGALESEHVAAAIDFGIAADGAPYIVLEYLVGESLEHLLEREQRLPLERATNLVLQACRGVQAAHAQGIVHRDLKPHNLFLCRREDGTDLVKVLDFGVAKLEMNERGGVATRTGTVLGTPSYMSPEQARGEKSIDHASDVYALGAILYELLSGQKPHPGDSHNAILHHIATQPALPLASAQPGLPEELVAVVERALSGDPAARLPSAEAFAQAIAPWSRIEVWPAPKLEPSVPRSEQPSSTVLAPASPSPAPAAGSLAVSAVERKAPRVLASERSGMLVALGGALALVAVTLLLVLGRRDPASESTPTTAAPSTPARAAPAPEPAPTRPTATPESTLAPRTPAPAPPSDPVPAALTSAPTLAPPPKSASPPALATRPTAAPAPGRPAGRPQPVAPAPDPPRPPAKPAETPTLAPVTFDQKNPYQ